VRSVREYLSTIYRRDGRPKVTAFFRIFTEILQIPEKYRPTLQKTLGAGLLDSFGAHPQGPVFRPMGSSPQLRLFRGYGLEGSQIMNTSLTASTFLVVFAPCGGIRGPCSAVPLILHRLRAVPRTNQIRVSAHTTSYIQGSQQNPEAYR